jgi:RNA polymerase sigma-70 factor (ECF subfamily)
VETQRPTTDSVPDDAELVGRTLSGQRAAFDVLIERYQQRATSVSYRLLGNLHDALEVCQEAFIRAFRNLDTLDDRRRFGPWLMRIVTNLSLNFRRARGPRISFEDCLLTTGPARDERLSDSPANADRPGVGLAATELETRIQDGLAALPPQQRAALVLFSIERLPQREVADILGCSVEAVKWHVFQARKKMKVHLAEFL